MGHSSRTCSLLVVVQTNISSMTLLCWKCCAIYYIGPCRPKFSCIIFMCCEYIYDISWLLLIIIVFIQVVVVFIHVEVVFILIVVVYICMLWVYTFGTMTISIMIFLMVVVHCDLSEVWHQGKVRLHQKHPL